MKILFIIENYLPHIGGVEVVFRNLAEGLVKRGHSATIITHRIKGTAEEETINGVKVKRINCLGSRYLFTFLSIPAALSAAKNVDIVHTTTFNGFFPAWVAAKVRLPDYHRPRSIYNCRSAYHNHYRNNYKLPGYPERSCKPGEEPSLRVIR